MTVPEGFTSARRLCDDNGMVSQALADPQPAGDEFLTYRGLHNRLAAASGHELVTEDFHCTGSAHYPGGHIYCTSPAHHKPEAPVDYDDPSPNKRPWITITVEAEVHSDLAGMGLLWDGKPVDGLPAKFTASDVLALLKKDGRDSKDRAIVEWDLLGDPRIVVDVQWPGQRPGTWERSIAEWTTDA